MKVLSITLADALSSQHHVTLIKYDLRLQELRKTFLTALGKQGFVLTETPAHRLVVKHSTRNETLTHAALTVLLNKIGAQHAAEGLAIEALPLDIIQRTNDSLIVDAIVYLHAYKRWALDQLRNHTIRLQNPAENAQVVGVKGDRLQVKLHSTGADKIVFMGSYVARQLDAIMKAKQR